MIVVPNTAERDRPNSSSTTRYQHITVYYC